MRSAPQRRLFVAISRMRATVSAGRRGGVAEFDLSRQKSRNPRRCQRRIVSGWTIAIARRQPGSSRAATISRSRSRRVSRGRPTWRRRTTTWWRSTAFSRSRSVRVRTESASMAVSSEDGARALQIVEAMLRIRARTRWTTGIIRDFEHLSAAIASARPRLGLPDD